MKKLSLTTLIALLFISSTTFLFSADNTNTNSESLSQSYQRLAIVVGKNFKQTAETIAAIQDPSRQMPGWKNIRELKTKLWLQLLDQVDQTRNLNFDFNNHANWPFANIAPSGFRYNSGVDPAVIKEPEIRRGYEKAIDENNAIAARLDFERQLKRQDEELTATAIQYFNSAYQKTFDDANELVGHLDVVKDSKHKAELQEGLRDFLELDVTSLFRAS